MSRHLRRQIQKAQKKQVAETADILSAGAARRQTIAPEDLIVIGGQKFDLSKDYVERFQAAVEAGIPVNPDELFVRFVTIDGKVYDLDCDPDEPLVEIALNNTVVIDNRVLTIGDFGASFYCIIYEMYEQFLNACGILVPDASTSQKSVFRKGRADRSSDIIEYCRHENGARQALIERINPATLEPYWEIDWGNPNVTFEIWLEWTAATLRWRIKSDLKRRYEREIDIRNRDTLQTSKGVVEDTLVAVEKFLALPEKKRLTGV